METTLKQLAAIRRAVVAAAEADGQRISDTVTTEDLVMALVILAKQGHEARVERGRIRRHLIDEVGYEDDGRSTLTLVKALSAKRAIGGEGLALDPAVIEALREAIAGGEGTLSRGAQASLREILTGDGAAIEVALTERLVVDLVLTGTAYTEIAVEGGGGDVAVKLVDTTGQLAKLKELWQATGQLELKGKGRQKEGETSH